MHVKRTTSETVYVYKHLACASVSTGVGYPAKNCGKRKLRMNTLQPNVCVIGKPRPYNGELWAKHVQIGCEICRELITPPTITA